MMPSHEGNEPDEASRGGYRENRKESEVKKKRRKKRKKQPYGTH